MPGAVYSFGNRRRSVSQGAPTATATTSTQRRPPPATGVVALEQCPPVGDGALEADAQRARCRRGAVLLPTGGSVAVIRGLLPRSVLWASVVRERERFVRGDDGQHHGGDVLEPGHVLLASEEIAPTL